MLRSTSPTTKRSRARGRRARAFDLEADEPEGDAYDAFARSLAEVLHARARSARRARAAAERRPARELTKSLDDKAESPRSGRPSPTPSRRGKHAASADAEEPLAERVAETRSAWTSGWLGLDGAGAGSPLVNINVNTNTGGVTSLGGGGGGGGGRFLRERRRRRARPRSVRATHAGAEREGGGGEPDAPLRDAAAPERGRARQAGAHDGHAAECPLRAAQRAPRATARRSRRSRRRPVGRLRHQAPPRRRGGRPALPRRGGGVAGRRARLRGEGGEGSRTGSRSRPQTSFRSGTSASARYPVFGDDARGAGRPGPRDADAADGGCSARLEKAERDETTTAARLGGGRVGRAAIASAREFRSRRRRPLAREEDEDEPRTFARARADGAGPRTRTPAFRRGDGGHRRRPAPRAAMSEVWRRIPRCASARSAGRRPPPSPAHGRAARERAAEGRGDRATAEKKERRSRGDAARGRRTGGGRDGGANRRRLAFA